MATASTPMTIAPRYQKPPAFSGTDVGWRVLCDLYPSAETPDVIMAVVEYCATRKLDPLRKPVHVVPMYNTKLRRRVQVVMQGISELETTAHRTGLWAGMDPPVWGQTVTRKFRGSADDDRGGTVEVEISYPESCAVTVYRMVGGQRAAFTEPVYWTEAYGRAGFRSELPNARWTQAPRQMLHKCAKAAALRAAFPEDTGYAAEEMEGREIDAGGVTIEGVRDHGDATMTARDKAPDETASLMPPGAPRNGLDALDERHKGRWLTALKRLLNAAQTAAEYDAIRSHPSVGSALTEGPTTFRKAVRAELDDTLKRITAQNDPRDDEPPVDDPDSWNDPIGGLLAEVGRMDLIDLERADTNAQWRARVAEATQFPPDEDRLRDAMAARMAELRRAKQ